MEIKRKIFDVEVTAGIGSTRVNGVYIASAMVAVKGPNATNETFEVIVKDADSDIAIMGFEARSSDGGNARGKQFDIPIYSVVVEVSDASVDGTYTVLILGK